MKKKFNLITILNVILVFGIFIVSQLSSCKANPQKEDNKIATIHPSEYDLVDIPLPNLEKGEWVSNPDYIIEDYYFNLINKTISDFNDQTTMQFALVAVNKIKTQDRDTFASDLFNLWGIGYEDVNNGLLIVLDKDNKFCVIRTGLGTEKVLTDSVCSIILQNYMIPEFVQEEYGKGLYQGILEIIKEINNSPDKHLIISNKRSK